MSSSIFISSIILKITASLVHLWPFLFAKAYLTQIREKPKTYKLGGYCGKFGKTKTLSSQLVIGSNSGSSLTRWVTLECFF